MPVRIARDRGVTVRSKLENDWELLGRLSLARDGWAWIPTGQQAKMGIPRVAFGHAQRVQVRRIWGPWKQGLVTLEFNDAPSAALWVRNPNDVQNYASRLESPS
jgi:hypothetical protein